MTDNQKVSTIELIRCAAAKIDLCQISPNQKPFYYAKKFDQSTKTTVSEKGRIVNFDDSYKPWMK